MNSLVKLLSVAFLLLSLPGCNGITISPRGITINPPRVKPIVDPAPNPDDRITSHEFRFLILEDASDAGRRALSPVQLAMITGRDVRSFCDQHCVKASDGTPERRFLDYRDELTGVWKSMRDTYPPQSYPWLILTNGPASTGGPLPKTWEELKPLLDKYSGVAE